MRKEFFLVAMIAASCCNSAVGAIFQRDSTVHFKVVDFDGNPISNAAIRVNTLKKWIPGEGFGRDVFMDIDGKTDANGETKIVFLCKSLNFSFSVKADGYYGNGGGVEFARAGSGFTLRQTQFETNLVVRLKPIVNTVPMCVVEMPPYADRGRRYPNRATSGTWGFDMQVGDWVAPYGRGNATDFFVEYSKEHLEKDKALDCALVFTNGVCDGFYIAKCTETSFRSDYAANTNAVYMKRLDFDSWGKKYKGRYATQLLDEDEYIVIRTRTKCDARGRIVSAHYAKIYGSMGFLGEFTCVGLYFNPNENDPNLEADTKVNLMPGGDKYFKP